jgi:mono/diheme cytochrome c family protein
MRTSTIAAAAGLCLAAAGFLSSSLAADPPRAATAATAAPAQQADATTLLDSAGEGRRRFLGLNCYGCHGMFAAGGAAPSIIGAPRVVVESAVLNGRDAGMRSFRGIVSQGDISKLADYLQSIGSPNEPMFVDWWKKQPPK